MQRIEQTERVGFSNPAELVANASDYLVLMKVAFGRKMYAQVAHMGHLALELAIKAAYSERSDGKHPFGHDLQEISSEEFNSELGTTFYDEVAADSNVLRHYGTIRTAWSMQDRYLRRSVDKFTAIAYKQSFGEVTKWILANYVSTSSKRPKV